MSIKTINLTSRTTFRNIYCRLTEQYGSVFNDDERRLLIDTVRNGSRRGAYGLDQFGHSRLLRNMVVASMLCDQLGHDRDMLLAVMLYDIHTEGGLSLSDIERDWNSDTAQLVEGLQKVQAVYSKNAAAQSDNFRKLLLTFAKDIRVIIIMIVDRLVVMRAINHHPDDRAVRDIAFEASYLYAPLAHRLGLYAIKGEMEDLSLKYSNREMFTEIARKLNETKAKRDAYIADFISPVKRQLEKAGLNFDIKGRTKSIYSIWNKMRKQHNDVSDIYDLFAIRVILDVPREKEKAQCWLAYSIVTDMYQPNPARMKDWISMPKSNGYESLHITVLGPEQKWVEVQIRTRRMDMVAEKGLAAHWRYKEGGAAEQSSLDDWMKNVRDILEAAESGPMELVKNLKMDLYKEVFVFTPKGDLYK
ncbi:MAG: HD domain-containing protein, partial [Paramuribaculum sp.]|nr:HD domain-containing protein [Paramuribaculum sp.]